MSGLLCPECRSSDSAIRDTRPQTHGHRRRRICPNGHRFTTLEVVVSEKPRRLVGLQVSDMTLAKGKIIARITAALEAAL